VAEEVDEFANGDPETLDGSLSRFTQERLELGEGVLDGIEVGTVGREVEEMGASSFDQLAHSGAFVAREIVHDHCIALAQFWDEDLLDVGLEGDAIDRAVQDERRDEAAQRQSADKCRRFPMALRNANPQAFAAQTPAIAARHVG
jgi:hypothetical protein